MEKGYKWRIGNGVKVHIWEDNWILNSMVSKFGPLQTAFQGSYSLGSN